MDPLGLLALLVGLIAGIIAIAEKAWGILPGRFRMRRRFRKHYDVWRDSDHSAVPSHDEFRVVVGVALSQKLDPGEMVFALLTALQHGDRSLHELIRRNADNDLAVREVVKFMAGRGVRVGWRAEYALSKLPRERVMPVLHAIVTEPSVALPLREAAQRVLDDGVVSYLEDQCESAESKYRNYAREVLAQIGADIP